MIKVLLDPTVHRDPYVWAAVLLAHGAICQGVTVALIPMIGPAWAVAIVSMQYLFGWEGAQLRTALRRGDRKLIAAADGAVDWVAVTLGCVLIASAWTQNAGLAVATWAALLVVAAVGYETRSRRS